MLGILKGIYFLLILSYGSLFAFVALYLSVLQILGDSFSSSSFLSSFELGLSIILEPFPGVVLTPLSVAELPILLAVGLLYLFGWHLLRRRHPAATPGELGDQTPTSSSTSHSTGGLSLGTSVSTGKTKGVSRSKSKAPSNAASQVPPDSVAPQSVSESPPNPAPRSRARPKRPAGS